MNEIHSASPRTRAARRFSFDNASIWVLTITIALAAIAFIPVATVPFIYLKVSILAMGGIIALALYILARLTRGNVIIPPATLIGALWLVPLAYLLSTLFSGVGVASAVFGTELETDTFGFMLIIAVTATLAALVFRRTNQYKIFFNAASIVFGFIVVMQLIFLILGHVMPNSISATANLVGSFIDLGMLTGLGVSLVLLAIRFLSIRGKFRIYLWIMAVLGLFVLALVNSTIMWVLTALTALGLFIESILRRSKFVDEGDLEGVSTLSTDAVLNTNTDGDLHQDDVSSLIAPLVVLVISLFFIIGGSTIGSFFTTTFGTNTLDVRPSWQATFNIGSHTYASSPIFGSGPGSFESQWLKFRDRSLNSTVFWNINFTSGIGIIPTSFVTTGLFGALAWIAFLILFIIIGLRALLFKTPIDTYARFVSVATFSGALYVFALMVFAVPGPIVIVVGFVLAGLFISSLRYTGQRQEWGVVFARNPRVGFIIVFGLTLLLLGAVITAYVVIERYLADSAYYEASAALSSNNLTAATNDINRSILFAPTDRAYQLAAEIGIAQMNAIAGNTSLTPSQAQQEFQSALSESVQSALTATKLGPNNYQNWAVLGQVYQTVVPLNIDGAYQNSKTAYEHAEQLDPTNPVLPYTVAQLDIAGKDDADAETDLTQAITLKPDYTEAIFVLAQLEAEEGKAADALQAAEAAAYFDPSDPTVLFEVGILRSANGDTAGAIQALSQAVQLNPQYANARFFLAVMYAIDQQYPQALTQLQAVAALSSANASAVGPYITVLEQGKDPFPASSLGALGLPEPGVTDSTGSAPQSSSISNVATTTPSASTTGK